MSGDKKHRSWGNHARSRGETMTNIIMAIVLLLTFAVSTAKAQEAKTETQGHTYVDALRQCGTEWKASDQRKATKKGEGIAAWNTFRAECVARVGYTSKRRGQVGGSQG